MTDQFSLTKLECNSNLRSSEFIKHSIANMGYLGFETYVQHSGKNAVLLEECTGISERILRHQGSDFFAAPAITYALGTCALKPMIKLVQKTKPNVFTNFCYKNYRLIRSAITFAGLTGYEYLQGQEKARSFDVPDVVAYGLGVTAFCHAEDIGKFFWKNVNSVFKSDTKQKAVEKIPSVI